MLVKHLLLLCVLFTVVGAQLEEPRFTAESNVVLVPTLVRDQNGDPVYGLSSDDFIVEDDGALQSVRLDEEAEGGPISMMIAIQRGRRAKHEFSRIRGLGSMLDPILRQPQTEAALLVFDSGLDLIEDFTADTGAIEAGLQELEPGDKGAAILDAVQYSVKLLNKRPKGRRRVLLLISETRDHGSHFAKPEDVVTLVGDSSTAVYALSFAPGVSNVLDTARGTNQDEMRPTADVLAVLALAAQAMRKNAAKTIAAETGGEYQLFETEKAFEAHMMEFTNHLHSRYLLSFEPNDPHPGLHQIRVHLKQPAKGTVLARSSYWAGR
jgi:VWFA-related protein